MRVPMDTAFARGLCHVIGNFSGRVNSIRTHAAELGRRTVVAIFDPDGGGQRRRVIAMGRSGMHAAA